MSNKPYWHCDKCGGNFDYGESCDCNKKPSVSEMLILGVDMSSGEDVSCIQVAKVVGNTHKIINTIYGKEAEQIYNILVTHNGITKL
jgi:hypothetical protein